MVGAGSEGSDCSEDDEVYPAPAHGGVYRVSGAGGGVYPNLQDNDVTEAERAAVESKLHQLEALQSRLVMMRQMVDEGDGIDASGEGAEERLDAMHAQLTSVQNLMGHVVGAGGGASLREGLGGGVSSEEEAAMREKLARLQELQGQMEMLRAGGGAGEGEEDGQDYDDDDDYAGNDGWEDAAEEDEGEELLEAEETEEERAEIRVKLQQLQALQSQLMAMRQMVNEGGEAGASVEANEERLRMMQGMMGVIENGMSTHGISPEDMDDDTEEDYEHVGAAASTMATGSNGGNGGNGGNGDGGEEERLYQKAEHAAKMAWLEQIKDKLDPGAAAEMQVRLAV